MSSNRRKESRAVVLLCSDWRSFPAILLVQTCKIPGFPDSRHDCFDRDSVATRKAGLRRKNANDRRIGKSDTSGWIVDAPNSID